ncbi:hypothetical protein KA005_12915 [bacterium]|nr:hypothetical protein [bacterium]
MRNITARRLKNEALDIMPKSVLNYPASYPTDGIRQASNPYKNFIRRYRRLHA